MNNNFVVFIVEDEEVIIILFEYNFEKEGYIVLIV